MYCYILLIMKNQNFDFISFGSLFEFKDILSDFAFFEALFALKQKCVKLLQVYLQFIFTPISLFIKFMLLLWYSFLP
jgi:hypothetical protein